ncbi:DUF3034 family protein [Glaciecola siphonariae]|uniref:DUF3034 family protein n=1 Tax=Glaciecola siphonariae TaxID=521012 RepID=A0ABV9M224_9ALTE
MRRLFLLAIYLMCQCVLASATAADGKLIGTAGLMQVEGAGGGGIVPWATLAGYDSREQISLNAMFSQVSVDDYRLRAMGASVSLYDRVELSVAKQRFDINGTDVNIQQDIYGAKVRLSSDAVYGRWPQISIGWQHKRLRDGAIARTLGADNSSHGNDFYLAATKVHLGALAGYNAVWNVTVRASKANQTGLLGFGSASDNHYKALLEASAGILLSRHVVIGAEYRQKPNNLGLGEQAWKDIFISYIPSKRVNFTLAWVDLGSIAGAPEQTGVYFSISGGLL